MHSKFCKGLFAGNDYRPSWKKHQYLRFRRSRKFRTQSGGSATPNTIRFYSLRLREAGFIPPIGSLPTARIGGFSTSSSAEGLTIAR